jgi:hypothetical protein
MLFIYLTTYLTTLKYEVELVNNELEAMWKEAIVACSRNSPGIRLAGLRQTTKALVRIAHVPAEI